MKVFITIDTEIWDTREDPEDGISRTLFGMTEEGEYGLRFLLRQFDKHRIKANFFVEPLFTLKMGERRLKESVGLIQSFGQDVQLHLHTEWLDTLEQPFLESGASGRDIKDFSLEDQVSLIKYGKQKLVECGATDVCAFRAGNYGGGLSTLAALRENGICFDTTHNACYMDSACDIHTDQALLQPRSLHGVIEFPVTCFDDKTAGGRHLQLVACSIREIKNTLDQAWVKEWDSVVIVMHSFELIKWQGKKYDTGAVLDKTALHRFLSLCRYLEENSDRFETVLFSELEKDSVSVEETVGPIESNIALTAERIAQQLYRRVMY